LIPKFDRPSGQNCLAIFAANYWSQDLFFHYLFCS